jgi:NTE family protein
MKKLGLALGGGAVRGLAHVGVLKVLEKYRVPVSCVAGTSFGALAGGLFASGVSAFDMEEKAKQMRGRAFWKFFRPSLFHSSLIESERIQDYLSLHWKDSLIEKLPVPFRAVATDLKSGAKVVIRKGGLFTAIRASSAIPLVFSPVSIDGKVLVDGGFSDPVPIDVVAEMGADVILAVNVVPPPAMEKNVKDQDTGVLKGGDHDRHGRTSLANADHRKRRAGSPWFLPNLLDVSMQIRNIVEYNLTVLDLKVNKPDFYLEPNHDYSVGWFEFSKASVIVEHGEKAMLGLLPELLRKLKA